MGPFKLSSLDHPFLMHFILQGKIFGFNMILAFKGARKPFYYDFYFKKFSTLRFTFLQIGAIHGIRTHWSTFSHVLFHFQVEENMEIVRNFEMSENSNFFSKQDRLAEQSSQTTNPPWVKIIFPGRVKADATNAPIWFSMHRIFLLRIENLYESLIKKC